MNNIFVTLFDSGYLSRGVVLHESLSRVCKDFKLYIIAFDDRSYDKLLEIELENTVIISLDEFEDDELLSVKPYRSRGEYCWTTTPKSVLYIFNKYHEDICTYVDADIVFFKDPECLIDEMCDDDVVTITEHRYADRYDQSKTSGKYCVQFMPFRNNTQGRNILQWWNDRCIEKCCMDRENGFCGDQKYLDDWRDRFKGVHVLQNIGGGVAPWNVSKYTFSSDENIIKVIDKANDIIEELVFYHMHNLVFFDKKIVQLTRMYYLPDTAIAHIYKCYLRLHEYVCNKYKIYADDGWMNTQHFRDDDIDHLVKEKNYYLYDLFM